MWHDRDSAQGSRIVRPLLQPSIGPKVAALPLAGYYAFRYAGLDLTRAEVEARLPELLELERQALGVIAA